MDGGGLLPASYTVSSVFFITKDNCEDLFKITSKNKKFGASKITLRAK